jgi:hypothetical protein
MVTDSTKRGSCEVMCHTFSSPNFIGMLMAILSSCRDAISTGLSLIMPYFHCNSLSLPRLTKPGCLGAAAGVTNTRGRQSDFDEPHTNQNFISIAIV